MQVLKLIISFALCGLLAAETVASNLTSTCVCTTVPCPVAGTNKLTEGDKQLMVVYRRIINLIMLYIQEVVQLELTFMPLTTELPSSHLPVQHLPKQTLTKALTPLLALKITLAPWMTTVSKTVMLVTFLLIALADLAINQSIFFLKTFRSTEAHMLNMKDKSMTASPPKAPPRLLCRGPSPTPRRPRPSPARCTTRPCSPADHAARCLKTSPTSRLHTPRYVRHGKFGSVSDGTSLMLD